MQDEKMKTSRDQLLKAIFIYSPFFIIFYNLTGNLSNVIYLPTLPALTQDFHTSTFLSQLTMTVWFLGVALPQVYFGLLADKIGYRPFMLWGGCLFIFATFACWVSPDIYVLLVGRFLQGIGVSSLNIATFATFRSYHYDEKTSVRFISWVNITGSLAPLISPVIGSLLFEFYGWRSTFACIFFLASFSVAGLYFFMIEGSDFQNKNTKLNFKTAVNYYKLLLNKKLMIHTLAYTSFLAALIAYLISAPFVMKDLFQIPIKYFGLTQLLPFLFFILGSLIVNVLMKILAIEQIIMVALNLIGLSIVALLALVFFPFLLSIYSYIIVISLFLLGFGIVGGPLISIALGSTPNKGGSAAFLSLSMASLASLASFLTALLFHGHFMAIGLIIVFFMSLGLLSYILCINIPSGRVVSSAGRAGDS